MHEPVSSTTIVKIATNTNILIVSAENAIAPENQPKTLGRKTQNFK